MALYQQAAILLSEDRPREALEVALSLASVAPAEASVAFLTAQVTGSGDFKERIVW